jgi:hypothetical protein
MIEGVARCCWSFAAFGERQEYTGRVEIIPSRTVTPPLVNNRYGRAVRRMSSVSFINH